MSISNRSKLRNTLLLQMAESDFDLLAPELEAVELPKGFVIVDPGQPIGHVYFPDSGVGSIIAMTPEGQQAEAGLYGRDGMAPIAVLLGSDRSVHRELMQLGGAGHRIEARGIVAAIGRSPGMRDLFMRYVQASVTQSAYTSLSNAVHPVDERLARWILMCHDRTDGHELPLTHEYISIMLAVRRPSVTTALHVLEGNGFIRSERGFITIRDRKALEDFAGDAYGKPEAEYRRLIGSPAPALNGTAAGPARLKGSSTQARGSGSARGP